MSYKNENMKMIELHENGLDIQFRIRENGVVELADFSSQEVKKAVMEPKEDICYPAVEIHRSGTGSLNMHAYKNNINQSSVDFVYENHEGTGRRKRAGDRNDFPGKAEGSISYAPV